jgi:hypothetical protein
MQIVKPNRLLAQLCLILLTPIFLLAQDTTTIQTFTWQSDNRSDIFEFPNDSSKSYSKIIMEYNMRCHDNQVGSGSVGCREWDYSCNTFITDSARTDSVMTIHPSHLISGFLGTSYSYSNDPIFAYTQFDRTKTTLDPASTSSTHKVLQDDATVDILDEDQAYYQFVMSAEEMSNAGLITGEIHGIEMPFLLGDFMSMSFRIRLIETNRDEVSPDSPITGNWQEVFFNELAVNSPGMNQLYFHTPFDWDGTSNIGMEIIFNDKMTPTSEMILGEDGSDKAILSNQNDHIFALNGAQYFQPSENHFRGIENEITIMAWIYGNPASLPSNTYLLEGVDDLDRRQINLHLPWGNGQVYWDCGNDGSGYDRINKQANEEDYEGRWNHWAFTKNAISGTMRIYLNGQLWHSGTGMNKPIDLKKLNIGKGFNSAGTWSGWVNDMSLWRKELTEMDIRDVMSKTLDPSHPYYSDLLLYFDFEEMRGSTVTNVRNNQDYQIIGSPSWRQLRAEELFMNFESIDARPSVAFIQGDVTVMNEANPYRDSTQKAPNWVRPFEVIGTDLVENTSAYLWEAGTQYVVNEQGDVIDSTFEAADGTIDITDLTYFRKFPSKFEILSLVTPYGNGLGLGADGKTFFFDVTDFTPILRGEKRISIELGGQWQEELDIKFHFIEGTPAREVLDIQNIWRFQRGNYGAIQSDDVFEPRTVSLHSDAHHYKIRSSITGHGQNGEFQPRNHYIDLDGGTQDFVYQVWKECSTIPIYPQGGTWIFDRAGWCPGDPTLLFEHDITDLVQQGGTVQLDYGVNGPHMDQANYLVSNQLVSYGPITRSVDAAIEDIIRPSMRVEWERENPSCNEPTIVLKNYGSENLTSVEIEYGVVGGQLETHIWNGDLAFEKEEKVVLPILRDDFWKASNGNNGYFIAKVVGVNGSQDQNTDNDRLTSEFELPTLLPGPLQFEFATNNRGSETSYQLKNQAGEVLFEGSGFDNNSKYVIDLDLAPGCYSLEFNDSGDDGLYYWYWEQTGQSRGAGYLRFNRIINGRSIGIKGFEREFGRFVHFDFGVESITSSKEARVLRHLSIDPNPSDGNYVLNFFSEESGDLEVTVTNAIGQIVKRSTYYIHAGNSLNEPMDLTDQLEGIYLVRITQNDRTTSRTLIKQ